MNLLIALEQFSGLQGEQGRIEADVESLKQRFELAEKIEGTKNELDIERNNLVLRLRKNFSEQEIALSEAILTFEGISKSLPTFSGQDHQQTRRLFSWFNKLF